MKWEYIGTGPALVGIGLTLTLAVPPPWWPKMSVALVNVGVLGGIVLTVAGIGTVSIGAWPGFPEARLAPSLLMLLGASFVVAGTVWQYQLGQQPTSTVEPGPTGQGGRGGGAKVGGSGIAIGGPGGHGGKYGRGGEGGGGEVKGDGFAAGGAGGSAGDEGVWRPPAKSGYEIFQRRMGLPVDPYMRQFGRGGAEAGYEPKLQVIEQLRAAYFLERAKKSETIFENINAVPLDYLNEALATKNETWRVRIIDDEYEFFIPND